MDVGLNNINKLHLALDFHYLNDVEWIIEATSTEQHDLWARYHKDHVWKQESSGHSFRILELDVLVSNPHKQINKKLIAKHTLPVTIQFNYAIIDGHKILFYECTSLLAHYGYIEAFFITYFQRTHDDYTLWNQTDAMNFHNCINYLDTIDIEPRKTKYKKDKYNNYNIFKNI